MYAKGIRSTTKDMQFNLEWHNLMYINNIQKKWPCIIIKITMLQTLLARAVD